MATVVKWNGKDVPDELRGLATGRDVIESVDALPAPTEEEEKGLEEGLDTLDRGDGVDVEVVRAKIDALVKR